MQSYILCVGAFITLCIVACSAQPCPLDVRQTMINSFVEDGQFHSLWRVDLTVPSSSNMEVSSVRLSLSPPSPNHPLTQVRGMESADPLSPGSASSSAAFYRLPKWRAVKGGLKASQSHGFEYVVRGMAPASVSLSSVSCVSTQSDHSASALPFYAGPWLSLFNTKPSPAASPVPSSSTQQPSRNDKCVVKVEQLARSESAGGLWFDSEFIYRTYELNITNVGRQPLAWSHIQVSLRPDEELYEWWNLVRPTATEPVLKLTTNGGLESGGVLKAGYVVRSPLLARGGQEPTLALSQVSCVGAEIFIPAPPALCRANLNITARTDKDRSRWSDGEYFYQVWDVKMANMGSRLITDARLSLPLSPQAEIIQWWDINRTGSASVFHPAAPVRVGTTLSAGFIERVPLSAMEQHHAIKPQLDSISCV